MIENAYYAFKININAASRSRDAAFVSWKAQHKRHPKSFQAAYHKLQNSNKIKSFPKIIQKLKKSFKNKVA